jgi:O-antigen biosynthesis protein
MTRTVDSLVSVVMLVRDRPEYTRMALESIAACDGDLEFVVVDNGSGPSTAEVLAEFRDRGTHATTVLRFEDDAGGSARRNAGVAAACGEYVFFVDNDVLADDRGVIRVLSEALAADRGIAAVSPQLRYPGSDLIQCAGGGATCDGRIGLVGRGDMLDARHRGTRDQAWAPTAALMVRRSSFDRAGGFDEAFDPVALCEDVDLCCRMRSAGEGIRYVGGAPMRHYEGMTFDHVGYDKLSVWKRHVRVLRARWSQVFAAGPSHAIEDLAWHPIGKDYSDPANPRVWRLDAAGEPADGTTFFASGTELKRTQPPVVRVAVLGCGQAAVRGALPALAASRRGADAPTTAPFFDFGPVPAARVTGIADPDLTSLLAAANWYDVPHAARDAMRLLDTVPAEGVVICTPPEWHNRLTLAALERRQSVLVEKPAVLNEEQLDSVLAALAAQVDLEVVVNLPYAHHPAVAALRDIVVSGTLGAPRSFKAEFEHGGPRNWAPRASWYDRLPGGVVTDLGLHAIDAVERILCGSVDALGSSHTLAGRLVPVRARLRAAVRDCAGTIEVGWDAPAPRFDIEISGADGAARARLIPFRTPGAVVEVHSAAGTCHVPVARLAAGGPYAEFVACLRGGPPARTRLAAVASGVRAMIAWAQAVREDGQHSEAYAADGVS